MDAGPEGGGGVSAEPQRIRCMGVRNNFGKSWRPNGWRCTKTAATGERFCVAHRDQDEAILRIDWRPTA